MPPRPPAEPIGANVDVLLESPLAVAALGLVPVTAAAIVYAQTKSRESFAALLTAVVLAVAAVFAERLYETPREQVRSAVATLFAAIEANDLPGVLRQIDPQETAGVRADAETLMPLFTVESAGVGGDVEVAVSTGPNPGGEGATATASLTPLIRVQHRRSGAAGAYFDALDIQFTRRGGRWLVTGYQAAQDWRGGAARLAR